MFLTALVAWSIQKAQRGDGNVLSFRVVNPGTPAQSRLEVECDAAGISTLLSALGRLVGERASHIHLKGLAAGGSDLDAADPWGRPAVHEVIINYAEGD